MSVPPGAGSTISRGIRQQREPAQSIPGVRPPGPGSSIASSRWLSQAGPAVSAVAPAVAPPERLFAGNLRRLWLSEIASTAGDTVLGAGLLIWFVQLRYSLTDITFLLVSFAVPAALVTLFAGSLAGVRRTQRALWLVGALRVLLSVLFIALYFDSRVSPLYILPFGLSLASNLRLALRRGAVAHAVPVRARGLLASGDQVAAGVLAVAGPALATLLYVLNGERIFAIALGAAACYVLALIGDSHATPLPDKILYQRPAEDEVHSAWEEDQDSGEDAAIIAAEQKAAVWELAPPPHPAAALADVDHGLQIAGAASHPQMAFVALAALALAGGVLALLEPFYVWTVLQQAPYALGFLLIATGVGAAIGSAIVVEVRGGGRLFLLLGLAGSGAGLIALTHTNDLPHVLGIVALLGLANVFAVRGGQVTLLRHFVPVGQRAVAQALAVTRAWLLVVGIGVAFLLVKHHTLPVPTLGLLNLLVISGMVLLVIAVVATVIMILPNRLAPVADDGDEELEPLPEDDIDTGEYSRYRPAADGRYDESSRYQAYDGSGRYVAYDASGRYEAYDASSRYSAYEGPGSAGRSPERYADEEDHPPYRR